MERLSSLPGAKDSTFKAVLFDCDGVICEPLPFARVLREKYGILPETTAHFFRGPFSPALIGKANVLDLLPPYLKEWGWPKSSEEFLAEWLHTESKTRAEVISLIKEVRSLGYFTALATNQEVNRGRYLRNQMGFDSLFDRCFISSELETMKPERSYFEKVTAIIGVPASQILFIDDQENYVSAAKAYGWSAIQFVELSTVREELSRLLRMA